MATLCYLSPSEVLAPLPLAFSLLLLSHFFCWSSVLHTNTHAHTHTHRNWGGSNIRFLTVFLTEAASERRAYPCIGSPPYQGLFIHAWYHISSNATNPPPAARLSRIWDDATTNRSMVEGWLSKQRRWEVKKKRPLPWIPFCQACSFRIQENNAPMRADSALFCTPW